MTPELKKIILDNLHSIHDKAKKIVEQTGGHPPILFLLRDSDAEAIDFSTYIEDKDLMAVMIKAYQDQDDVDGSILLTEAWVLKIDTNSEEGKRLEKSLEPQIMPSESPDREEVLFYMVETRGGDIAAQAPITREGKKTIVGDLQVINPEGKDDRLTGRFVGGTFNS